MLHEKQQNEQSAGGKAVKTAGKKLAKRAAKKALKKAATKAGAKAAAKVALKTGLSLIGKAVAGLVGFVGGPFIIGALIVLAALILIFVAVALLFSIGVEEELNEEAYELKQYIAAAADSTVDMSKPEQIPYKVPPALIIVAMELYDVETGEMTEKETVDIVANALKPEFTYSTRQGSIETKQTVCREDEGCKTTESTTPFEIDVFESVQAWDRSLVNTYEPYFTEWVTTTRVHYEQVKEPKRDEFGKIIPGQFVYRDIKVTTKTKTRAETFVSDTIETMDYSHYDMVLSGEPFNYGQQDKLFVEALYAVTGGEIHYKEWLTGNSLIGFNGTVTPGSSVPSQYMEIYLAAEKAYRVDWYYIAAIHYVETGFSTHPTMISSVGAEGHTQFMPCTWMGWSYLGCKGSNGYVSVSESVKYNPITIDKYGGFGIDADKNGKASPWDIKDAIFATASYLNANGFSKNIDKSIRAYNHSDIYVRDVKAAAARFKTEATYMPGGGDIPALAPGSFMRPAVGRNTSGYGGRYIDGEYSYHYGVDIASGQGTPIVAVADGVVSRAVSGCPPKGYYGSNCGGGWGNHVWVKHTVGGASFEAVYGHFARIGVVQGQIIKQGQFLGGMGTSGSSTGVHLHFELHSPVRSGYRNVLNPTLYIPM
ncbi:peptidoglycan DD-metalloendopeptidase family protein [Planococcus lenghuensis]|uniref:M23ase beta-sheet core domain-containing protein n=1 Tax=Planococcus lenghuensis TaxID=2213202 RepID=A0A1Q2L4E4_9BACL|nr:peptidoglycan DD-metalloendopeptidase family protein [Planococcus lenghuensis]AQQ55320.1 hypothetical protein B0X71_19285 [Planococcus lenghuensis]